MMAPNRYLVWWQSSVSGDHYEAKHSPGAAQRLLDRREQREFFVRGLVIDMAEHTSDPSDFMEGHRAAVSARR